MYQLLLAILVIDGLVLASVILLQAGKGGGLAAMGGGAAATDGVMGGRQATSLLTRTTWVTGTIFLVLSLVLSIMSSRAAQPTSILRQGLEPQTVQPEAVLPGLDEAAEPAADPASEPVGDAGAGEPGA